IETCNESNPLGAGEKQSTESLRNLTAILNKAPMLLALWRSTPEHAGQDSSRLGCFAKPWSDGGSAATIRILPNESSGLPPSRRPRASLIQGIHNLQCRAPTFLATFPDWDPTATPGTIRSIHSAVMS